MTQNVLLASKSSARLAMLKNAGLKNAGVQVTAVPASVDEDSIKSAMVADGAKPRDIADALAEAKALKVSRKYPGDLVIGSDQILVTANGPLLDKPESEDQAKDHLRMLSGQSHTLISAAVICEAGKPVWRQIETAKMNMRVLSDAFIEEYVALHWDVIRHCVGCYRIEAEGAQLFEQVEGSQFAVIGMPLLPVLGFLRVRGILTS
jgi:septum formation protein